MQRFRTVRAVEWDAPGVASIASIDAAGARALGPLPRVVASARRCFGSRRDKHQWVPAGFHVTSTHQCASFFSHKHMPSPGPKSHDSSLFSLFVVLQSACVKGFTVLSSCRAVSANPFPGSHKLKISRAPTHTDTEDGKPRVLLSCEFRQAGVATYVSYASPSGPLGAGSPATQKQESAGFHVLATVLCVCLCVSRL